MPHSRLTAFLSFSPSAVPRSSRLRPVVLAVLGLLTGGAALAQAGGAPLKLRPTPMLSEVPPDPAQSAAVMYGDHVAGRADLETLVEGRGELRRPGLVVRGEQLFYDQATDIASSIQRVDVNARGDRYSGAEGQLQLDAFEGFFLRPTYQFLANGAYGSADRVNFLDRDRAVVLRGTYTTCRRDDPDWRPDWMLHADRLEIDQEEGVGHATNGLLEFQGVPILPIPTTVSFPIDERRKSGWLPPTIGLDNKSGLNLSVPYYWNIAPNRDATITPILLTRRGAHLAGEFRYLESGYQGRVNANWMSNDRLRDRERWGFFARHNGTHDTGLDGIGGIGVGLNLNRVSDNDYWRDFRGRGLSLTTRLLANDATVSWGRGDFAFSARTLKWQTLQDVTAPIVPPYDRLPQLVGRWGRVNDRGFDYSIDGDYTRFRGDRAWTNQPDADRSFLHAQLSRPFLRPWGFLTPKVQLDATNYQFSQGGLVDGSDNASRVVPTLSLDSGLVFEREASYFGRGFRQTLEPRLMYVYTPYRSQNRLPNYDSGLYDFNFATIWAENSFAGHDRIVDNNLVTAGLTTRLLDPETGAEAVRLGVAQRYRFSPQDVILPGGTPTGRGLSDVMLGASLNWDTRWSFDTVVQYNPDTRRSTRTTIHARYSPQAFHTVSVAYRHQRDLKSESVDVGWQWPLADLLGGREELGRRPSATSGSCNGRWYGVGRLNYDLKASRLVDTIVGLEYDAGCWVGRVVYEQLQSTLTSANKRIMFQIELIGLSRIGSNPLQILRNNVPRYQLLHQDETPPSRFTTYE